MRIRLPYRSLLALSLCALFGCADYAAAPTAHSLDYLEFHDPAGWVLHIDGDGSGRLRCKAFPERRINYLPATFNLSNLNNHFSNCAGELRLRPRNCLRAVYFQQMKNSTQTCHCPDASWTEAYFAQAFVEINHSPARNRDRRLLRRHWLHEPPIAFVE